MPCTVKDKCTINYELLIIYIYTVYTHKHLAVNWQTERKQETITSGKSSLRRTKKYFKYFVMLLLLYS